MVDKIKKERSWGGAMFHLLYLALSQKYVWAVLVCIGFMIPFVNFILMVVMFIVGGLKANNWLDSDSSLTPAQKKTYATLFDRVGYLFFILMVVALVGGLILMALGIGGGLLMHQRYGGEFGPDFGAEFDMGAFEALEGY